MAEAPAAPEPAVAATPGSVISPKELAVREEESRKAQALAKRQTEELKEKHARESARKTKKERDAEEAAAKIAAGPRAAAATAVVGVLIAVVLLRQRA